MIKNLDGTSLLGHTAAVAAKRRQEFQFQPRHLDNKPLPISGLPCKTGVAAFPQGGQCLGTQGQTPEQPAEQACLGDMLFR